MGEARDMLVPLEVGKGGEVLPKALLLVRKLVLGRHQGLGASPSQPETVQLRPEHRRLRSTPGTHPELLLACCGSLMSSCSS